MKSTYIVTAAGFFGFGAIAGWAVAADIHSAKAKRNRDALRDVIKRQALRMDELVQENNAAREAFYSTPGEVVGEPHEPDTELPFDEASDEPVAYDEVEIVASLDTPEAPAEAVVETPEPTDEELDQVNEEARSNLQAIIDQYTANPEASSEFVQSAEPSTRENYVPPAPITQAVYSWDPEGPGDEYAKITLTWYPKQRTLLDDAEDVINDVNGTIGWKSLDQFGYGTEDPNVVFVRNHKMLTDFEVVKDDESDLPLHVKYGMGKQEFETNKAAGLIHFERGASD